MTEEEYKAKIKQALQLLQECESAKVKIYEEELVLGAVFEMFPISDFNQDVFACSLLTILDGLAHV